LPADLFSFTGDASDSIIRAFLEKNNLPHITKPFDRETLLKMVGMLSGKQDTGNGA
jgi:hypothetical protein